MKTNWLGNIGGWDGATIIGPTVIYLTPTSASSATGKAGSPVMLTCCWSSFWAVQPSEESSSLRMLRAPRQLVHIVGHGTRHREYAHERVVSVLGDGFDLPLGAHNIFLSEERPELPVGHDTDVRATGLGFVLAVVDLDDIPLHKDAVGG